MLFDLLFHTGFELVKIRFAQPLSARLHAGRKSISHGRDARIVLNRNRAAIARSGGRLALLEGLGSRFEPVCDHRWEPRRLVLPRRPAALQSSGDAAA